MSSRKDTGLPHPHARLHLVLQFLKLGRCGVLVLPGFSSWLLVLGMMDTMVPDAVLFFCHHFGEKEGERPGLRELRTTPVLCKGRCDCGCSRLLNTAPYRLHRGFAPRDIWTLLRLMLCRGHLIWLEVSILSARCQMFCFWRVPHLTNLWRGWLSCRTWFLGWLGIQDRVIMLFPRSLFRHGRELAEASCSRRGGAWDGVGAVMIEQCQVWIARVRGKYVESGFG